MVQQIAFCEGLLLFGDPFMGFFRRCFKDTEKFIRSTFWSDWVSTSNDGGRQIRMLAAQSAAYLPCVCACELAHVDRRDRFVHGVAEKEP
mmetsp:Transcript_50347/g.162964  ORF Transcript_50347/g.162964 Transcript_50347/m.162964 type:complete len:90 (-) Transcript_50347:135-404(-)